LLACPTGYVIPTVTPFECKCTVASDCATCDAADGAKCLTCASGKSMLTGTTVCVTNPTSVTNCDAYDTATTCKTCAATYTLSTDKKTCAAASTSGAKLAVGLSLATVAGMIIAWNWKTVF